MVGVTNSGQGLLAPSDLTLVPIDTTVTVTGDYVVVTGIPSQSIRVHTLFLTVGNNAVEIKFKSGATTLGTLQSTAAMALDFRDRPIFQCGAGQDFIINVANSRRITGWLEYARN